MIVLRGHHLICLNFFRGEGYNEFFVENLRKIMKRIDEEAIEIAHGPDDICRSCPHLEDNRCIYDKNSDEKVREMDSQAVRLFNIKSGSIRWSEIKNKIPLIFSQWYKNYCLDCDWLDECNKNEFFKNLKNMEGDVLSI